MVIQYVVNGPRQNQKYCRQQ